MRAAHWRCFVVGCTALLLARFAAGGETPGLDGTLRDCGFFMARVQFASDSRDSNPWNLYPGADKNAIDECGRAVRCRVYLPPGTENRTPWTGPDTLFNAVVDLHNIEDMRNYPLLFMTSDGCFSLDGAQKANLKQYLDGGGFLLLDDCVADTGTQDHFYQCAHLMLEDLLGQGAVTDVPREHEVFHNVFDLRSIGMPFMQGRNHGAKGVFLDGRLAVFLCSTDLHCGWVDRARTRFTRDGRFGPHTYEEATQMAVNLFMYVMSH